MLLVIKPEIAIIIGLVIIKILGFILIPEKGLISKWMIARKNNRRILLEDTLKYIFDCEYKNVSCGLHSIAGNLGIPSDKAADILEHLQSIGLIKLNEGSFELTDPGRSYALKIIKNSQNMGAISCGGNRCQSERMAWSSRY